ncbi:hypothetical protein LTR81_003557 [Elasticomyces elasticus]
MFWNPKSGDTRQLLILTSLSRYAGSTGGDDDPLVRALEEMLPGIQEAAEHEKRSQTEARQIRIGLDIRPDNHEETSEAPLNSEAAPMLRLLGEQVEASHDQTPLASNEPQSTYRRHAQALHDMAIALPSEVEMGIIFETRSSWWPLWRKSLDLVWGSAETTTLKSFATHAIAEADPCLLAILLVAFATATGDRKRFLSPVETHIVNNDELAGTEHGLSCLMILGLCYLNNLQPRRAWSVYRRANSLLQLNGIHLRHRTSAKRENIFWQLFHADRCLLAFRVSLMVGLPYSIPDHLTDLSIASVDELGASTFLYRHLAVLTGRVVDCISGAKGPSFSAVIQVEEQMESVLLQLPDGFLEIESIRSCPQADEQMMRLYRSVHYHQLRAYLHISFFLRTGSSERYDYGRRSCVGDSRQLVEAYVEIFDIDHAAASDGSILNLTAFTATVVILMSALGYDRQYGQTINTQLTDKDDWRLIYRVLDALKYGEQGIAGALCRQCHNALDTLIRCARTNAEGDEASVVLPYFGTVTFKRRVTAGPSTPAYLVNGPSASHSQFPSAVYDDLYTNGSNAAGLTSSTMESMPLGSLQDLQVDYHGPLTDEGALASWLPPYDWSSMQAMTGGEQLWNGNIELGPEWDWMKADLPPSMSF